MPLLPRPLSCASRNLCAGFYSPMQPPAAAKASTCRGEQRAVARASAQSLALETNGGSLGMSCCGASLREDSLQACSTILECAGVGEDMLTIARGHPSARAVKRARLAVIAMALIVAGCGGGGEAASPTAADPSSIEIAIDQRVTTELLRAFLSNQRAPAAAERTEAIRQMRLTVYAQGLACGSVDSDATLEITRTVARTSAGAAEVFARQLASQRRWSPQQFSEEFRTHRDQEMELATQTSACASTWNAEVNQRMGGAVSAAYEDAAERLRRDAVLQ